MEQIELSKILDFIAKIYEEKHQAVVDKIAAQSRVQETIYCSEFLNEFAADLPKAQAEYDVAALNKSNPFFKSRYADLLAVVQATRPALTKYGFSVLQDPVTHPSGELILHTILLHKSGQWVESRMRILPPKNDPQSMSSYVTYLKRTTYSSLVGVVTGDEDDDGEVAMIPSREGFSKGTALNAKYNPRETAPETITREQRQEAEYELAEYPDIAEMVLEGLKIQSIADMPKAKFQVSMNRIREIKNARNGVK